MSDALSKLAAFGAWALREARADLGDLNGGEMQDKAVDLGVLVPIEAQEPCGDGCRCQEYDDFPQTCYRYPPDVHALIVAPPSTPDQHPETKQK